MNPFMLIHRARMHTDRSNFLISLLSWCVRFLLHKNLYKKGGEECELITKPSCAHFDIGDNRIFHSTFSSAEQMDWDANGSNAWRSYGISGEQSKERRTQNINRCSNRFDSWRSLSHVFKFFDWKTWNRTANYFVASNIFVLLVHLLRHTSGK